MPHQEFTSDGYSLKQIEEEPSNNESKSTIAPMQEAIGRMTRRDVIIIEEDIHWNIVQQHRIPQVRVFIYDQGGYEASSLFASLDELGFVNLNGKMLFAFEKDQKLSIYLGEKPFVQHLIVPVNTSSCNTIIIKARARNNQQQQQFSSNDCASHSFNQNQDELQQQNISDSGRVVQQKEDKLSHFAVANRVPRQKERTIRFAIDIVNKWRGIFDNGYLTPDNRCVKVNLDQAAKIVGMSRKTLDDYRSHIKRGQEHDFDFEKHLDSKIGLLRAFNEGRNMPKDAQNVQKQQNDGNTVAQIQSQVVITEPKSKDFDYNLQNTIQTLNWQPPTQLLPQQSVQILQRNDSNDLAYFFQNSETPQQHTSYNPFQSYSNQDANYYQDSFFQQDNNDQMELENNFQG